MPPATVQQRKAAIERRKQMVQDNGDAGKSAPPAKSMQKRKTAKKLRKG